MITKKQQACVTRYVAGHYDQIRLNVPKGDREVYKQAAKKRGLSLNQLFITAVEKYIKDDPKN